ncbi:MAG: PAS domain S-box protein [Gemmatimonadales bacterium]|nr:MAG: PAS domain S-box protein [Gemmatimonadales bacterium]
MRIFPSSLRGRFLLLGSLTAVIVVALLGFEMLRDLEHTRMQFLPHALTLLGVMIVVGGGLWALDRTFLRSIDRLRRGASEAEAVRGARISEEGPDEFAALAGTLNRTLEARDRAEEELFRSAERHELVLRATRDMIWDWDLESGKVHRNEALRAFLGTEQRDAGTLAPWFERIPEPDRTRVRRSLESTLEGGGRVWTEEYPFHRADGVRVRILDRGYVVRREDGAAVRAVGVMSDVTEARRQSDEVRRARDRYESILRHAPFGVFLAASDGVILEWNPALESILGEAWEGAVPRRKAPEFFVNPGEFESLALDARQKGTVIGREALWIRADGEEIFVRLTASAFLERGRIALEVLAEDVTERRRLGEQVRQAQKMEAVGRLAGGVAHDFNNLLTVISGEARFLLSEGAAQGTVGGFGEDVRESLEAIQEAGDRGGGLTRQLLSFSRRQVVTPVPLDMNEVVEQVQRMLIRLLGEKVELRTALARDLPAVVADMGEMEQVLINLAVNSRDAMPDGGVLEIGTSTRRFTEAGRTRYPGLEPGDYVVLTVRDEGVGMDPRTQARIFEPFYTTKPVGKGTGLGLSTVYGIVTRGGGQVDVESEPGEGTTFRVLIPASSGEAVPARVETRAPTAGAVGEGLVMVVEDEERVRRMAERVLDRAGFDVISFPDPASALEGLDAPGFAADILVTDVRMPGMDGEELAERVRMRFPEMPVLFVSGYPEEVALQDRAKDRRSDFLAKPFTPQQLLQRVQLLLIRSTPRS